MSLSIYKTKQESGIAAAKFGAAKIRAALAEKNECRIIVATGASQFEMLTQLAQEPDINWSKVTLFHLDEYVGLPETHPASFRKYIKERFIAKLPRPLQEANFVPGDAPDLQAAIDKLGAHLQEKVVRVGIYLVNPEKVVNRSPQVCRRHAEQEGIAAVKHHIEARPVDRAAAVESRFPCPPGKRLQRRQNAFCPKDLFQQKKKPRSRGMQQKNRTRCGQNSVPVPYSPSFPLQQFPGSQKGAYA